jgi:hypothetical protein
MKRMLSVSKNAVVATLSLLGLANVADRPAQAADAGLVPFVLATPHHAPADVVAYLGSTRPAADRLATLEDDGLPSFVLPGGKVPPFA